MISCYCFGHLCGQLPELRGSNKRKPKTKLVVYERHTLEFNAPNERRKRPTFVCGAYWYRKGDSQTPFGWLYVKSHKRHNCCCFGFLVFLFFLFFGFWFACVSCLQRDRRVCGKSRTDKQRGAHKRNDMPKKGAELNPK